MRRKLLLGVVLTCAAAAAARAQQPVQRRGSIGVTFKSASMAENGFDHASLTIDYVFRFCSYNVWVLYGVKPGSVQAGASYWFEGRNYPLRAGWTAPQNPDFMVRVRASHGANLRYDKDSRPGVYRSLDDMGCSSAPNWVDLGSPASVGANPRTDRDRQDLLNAFVFATLLTSEPLRSTAIESEIRQQLRQDSLDAQKRADSLAMKARKDSSAAQARSDSLENARRAERAAAETDERLGKQLDSARAARREEALRKAEAAMDSAHDDRIARAAAAEAKRLEDERIAKVHAAEALQRREARDKFVRDSISAEEARMPSIWMECLVHVEDARSRRVVARGFWAVQLAPIRVHPSKRALFITNSSAVFKEIQTHQRDLERLFVDARNYYDNPASPSFYTMGDLEKPVRCTEHPTLAAAKAAIDVRMAEYQADIARGASVSGFYYFADWQLPASLTGYR